MNLNLTRRDSPRFAAALDFLDHQIRSGVKLGLDSTRKLLECVGNPHHGMRFIHVAGTNGKGSVCALLSGALTACGYRTGFFSSPHLVNIRERYRVNNQAVSEDEFAELIEEMRERAGHLFGKDGSPSFFEVTTVLGMMHFRKRDCDVVILEVGMGGRLDATNVIDPTLAIITRIGLDHMRPLGDTLHAIAGEKAGIIKPGRPTVVGPQEEEAGRRILEVAAAQNSDVCLGGRDFAPLSFEPSPGLCQRNTVRFGDSRETFETRFIGPHQLENVSVAWAALNRLNELGMAVDLDIAVDGLKSVRWPARLDMQKDGVLIDGAHNEAGVRVLVETLTTYFPDQKWNVLFAALTTKNWQRMIDLVAPIAESFVFVGIQHKKANTAEDLEAYLSESWPDIPCEAHESSVTGAKIVRERPNALVIGSLYMAGEVISMYTEGRPVPIEVSS